MLSVVMLSVVNKPFMMSVVMPNIVLLGVMAPLHSKGQLKILGPILILLGWLYLSMANIYINTSNNKLTNSNVLFYRFLGTIFIRLHFLRDLQMGPISYCVTLHRAGKAFQGPTL
jgi:hypothetical protein